MNLKIWWVKDLENLKRGTEGILKYREDLGKIEDIESTEGILKTESRNYREVLKNSDLDRN